MKSSLGSPAIEELQHIPFQSGQKFEIDFASKIKVFVAESHLRRTLLLSDRIATVVRTVISLYDQK